MEVKQARLFGMGTLRAFNAIYIDIFKCKFMFRNIINTLVFLNIFGCYFYVVKFVLEEKFYYSLLLNCIANVKIELDLKNFLL